MKQLKEKQKKSAEHSVVVKELDEELLRQLLAQYLHRLEESGKDLVKTQLSLCDFSLQSQDEILCTCHMHLQFNTINSIRQDLVDFFEEKTGIPKLKIRVILEESLQDAPTDRVLSKNEFYEALVKEFPLIKVLKEQLSLTVKAMYQIDPQELQQRTAEPEVEVDTNEELDPTGLTDDAEDAASDTLEME